MVMTETAEMVTNIRKNRPDGITSRRRPMTITVSIDAATMAMAPSICFARVELRLNLCGRSTDIKRSIDRNARR